MTWVTLNEGNYSMFHVEQWNDRKAYRGIVSLIYIGGREREEGRRKRPFAANP